MRERDGGEDEGEGECEGVGVAAWRRPGHPDKEKRGRQAGREVAWRGGARARRARSPPSVEDEDDRVGGGLGRLLAGPACCCWAAQGGGPGKSPSFIFFCFLIF